jgi:hypothetical protein
MLGNHIIFPFHIPGTLAANLNIRFKAPCDMHIKEVQAGNSANTDGTFLFGVSGDTDSILTASDIGDSNAVTSFTRANFAATNPQGKVSKGEILVFTVDFDGSAGTAAANLNLVVVATEG